MATAAHNGSRRRLLLVDVLGCLLVARVVGAAGWLWLQSCASVDWLLMVDGMGMHQGLAIVRHPPRLHASCAADMNRTNRTLPDMRTHATVQNGPDITGHKSDIPDRIGHHYRTPPDSRPDSGPDTNRTATGHHRTCRTTGQSGLRYALLVSTIKTQKSK